MKNNAKKNRAWEEYQDFLMDYLFPLLGIPNQNNIEKCDENDEKKYCGKMVFADIYRLLKVIR